MKIINSDLNNNDFIETLQNHKAKNAIQEFLKEFDTYYPIVKDLEYLTYNDLLCTIEVNQHIEGLASFVIDTVGYIDGTIYFTVLLKLDENE